MNCKKQNCRFIAAGLIEVKNAAINTLYNKADVLNRLSDTEIDTVYGFTNNKK